MDILLCSLLCEAGHPVAIPSHLPTRDVPEGELRIDRVYHRILVLDHLQCYIQLHACQLLLDTQHRPRRERDLLKSTGRMVSGSSPFCYIQLLTLLQVHQRCTEHRDRHCRGRTTFASHQDIEPTEGAEARPNLRLLPWRHHMRRITHATTVALRRLRLARHHLGQPHGRPLEQPRSQHRHHLLLPTHPQDLRYARVPQNVLLDPRDKYRPRRHDDRRGDVWRIWPGDWRSEEEAQQHQHELSRSWEEGCGRVRGSDGRVR